MMNRNACFWNKLSGASPAPPERIQAVGGLGRDEIAPKRLTVAGQLQRFLFKHNLESLVEFRQNVFQQGMAIFC